MSLKLQFDANQDFQLDAVQSVVALFEGRSRRVTEFQLSDDIIPNLAPDEAFSEDWLFKNLLKVQERYGIERETMLHQLEVDEGMGLVGNETHRYPNFTVEMETGTGKTYVYLRTIYELRRRYGFGKFVIVVPSIAIYEGVIKNFDITRDHFRALYGNEVINLIQYDGAQLSRLRAFATSTFAEVLVITLDSFNKTSNNIFKASEKLPGERLPYQYVQEARPILILDEPQNMGSDLAKRALRTLHPLFALRYSATHVETPNRVYRLTPFDAYQRNLVKKIQVAGVTQREDFNRPFLALESISKDSTITARVRTYTTDDGRTRDSVVTLRQGDDLQTKTNRDEHQGYRVSEIHVGEKYVEFENGIRLREDDTVGPGRPELFRVQIEETVKRHLETQEKLRKAGIKVLSLFFIDRVANYMDDDGLIKKTFDRVFNKLKKDHKEFAKIQPEEVRNAYFAKKKTKDGEQAIDTDSGTKEQREAEKDAFELIMRDKERLLSFDEKVCFIFAHSALKEGWDNPNVFQICTLHQGVSERRRRQEIGRGLRLCVNQDGARVFGEDANVLTVVANESYETYAGALQQEYQEDGDIAPPRPTNATRKSATRNDRIFKSSPDFKAFWAKLSQRTSYRLTIDTNTLIDRCVERLNNQTFPEPITVVERGKFVQAKYALKLEKVDSKGALINIDFVNTDGEKSSNSRYFKERESMGKLIHDDYLNPYQVVEIKGKGDNAQVVFGNNVTLDTYTPHEFSVHTGPAIRERATISHDSRYPVFNLIDRAARETDLTRPTLVEIFKKLKPDKKTMIFRNPEGFAGVFITEIKNALADQVAESIIFEVYDEKGLEIELEHLFPKTRAFPQRELIEAGERGLYDLVQIDSGVEDQFLGKVKPDENVVLFFKFPPAFKIKLPRLIGNYNPDWGIVRRRADGRYAIYLIRETKGGELDTLRFPNEKRKVRCAQSYFQALDMDYRQIHPDFQGWWMLEEEVAKQGKFGR
jgi:type III restriction enzyme